MTSSRQALGRWGERLAAEYLRTKNYDILETNVRTPYGEIDLVAKQEAPGDVKGSSPVIVFVEVKTRSSTAYGLPEESITAQKRGHMLDSAQAFLQEHPDLDVDWRIDVIAIRRFRSGREPQITHFENAIT
jgi:putative endonuclease